MSVLLTRTYGLNAITHWRRWAARNEARATPHTFAAVFQPNGLRAAAIHVLSLRYRPGPRAVPSVFAEHLALLALAREAPAVLCLKTHRQIKQRPRQVHACI